jgi:hypothetical protein
MDGKCDCNAALPPVRSEPMLDALWAFLCDCENAGDRTRKTARETFNQGCGEGEYRLARDVKHRMVILGYKPSNNSVRGAAEPRTLDGLVGGN